MSSFKYVLNCGQFVLTCDGDPISEVLDEVSIGFDMRTGALHRHGSVETVDAWFKKQQRQLREAGLDEWADSLIVMTGRFPVEEVNKVLAISGYAGRLYEKLISGEVVCFTIDDIVKQHHDKH